MGHLKTPLTNQSKKKCRRKKTISKMYITSHWHSDWLKECCVLILNFLVFGVKWRYAAIGVTRSHMNGRGNGRFVLIIKVKMFIASLYRWQLHQIFWWDPKCNTWSVLCHLSYVRSFRSDRQNSLSISDKVKKDIFQSSLSLALKIHISHKYASRTIHIPNLKIVLNFNVTKLPNFLCFSCHTYYAFGL